MKTLPPDELERLLNAAADGILDDVGEAELAAWLKRDPAARQHYREFMILHATLHWDYVQPAAAVESAAARPAVKMHAAWWRITMAAAAAVLAILAGWQWLAGRHATPGGALVSRNVALLSRAIDAEWSGHAPQPGQALAPGWLRLKAGAVQIEFARGARVLLEGPAEFRVVSDNEGFLQRGKLRAFVPPAAHGFTIRGEGFTAVDRGTEFGCLVRESGGAEVHVINGAVDIGAPGVAGRVLAPAEAVWVSAGKMEAIPAQPEIFMSDETFARRESGSAAAWRLASAALSTRPDAVIHYDFEQARDPARKLSNRGRGVAADASIVGGKPAQGRWPGKSALAFSHGEDRVRFTVPGEFSSLTLLAWVRVDALPNTQSSLLMSGAEQPGDIHWYLHKSGQVGFAISGRDDRWHSLHTPVVLRAPDFGKWHFFAVTFDGATRTATHFHNGQPVAAQVLNGVAALRPGAVELGNWAVRPGNPLRASKRPQETPSDYIRNLAGAVDEFALLSAPLRAEEIQRLYREGRPEAPPRTVQ